jgi:serine/threonine protein kinase
MGVSTPPASPSEPLSTRELAIGSVVAERYRLVKKLGEGGMGAVYLAEHVHMRKRFALKLLLPEAMTSAELVARFEREAVAAANINHPGVCAATDFGRLPDGSFFLVLEYIDGRSLRSIVAESALPPTRAAVIARQILSALAAAHGKGVIHRDMKPENVMVTQGDVVKVLDFGIAKLDSTALGEGQNTALTRMGAIYGTPAYLAPEQAIAGAIDHRVDLYSVGVLLHEMITGKPPFEGDGIIVLAKHVNEPPPPLVSPNDDVPPELAAFVQRLLAKKPDERPESASAALQELDAILVGLGVAPSSPKPPSVKVTSGTIIETETKVAAPVPVALQKRSPRDVIVDRARAFVRWLSDRLEPVARRIGVPVQHVLIALAIVVGFFVLVFLILALRGPTANDADTARPPRKQPEKDPPAAVAPSATEKKKSGDGVHGLGPKIKSTFR